jgi:hypothetical protein
MTKGIPTTFGLAIWRGDEYILIFLFAISSSPGLTFTIELLYLTSASVILFSSGSGLDVFQMPPHRQAVTVGRNITDTLQTETLKKILWDFLTNFLERNKHKTIRKI